MAQRSYSLAIVERPVQSASPLVSAVIVCHNQSRYLADAIASVLAQTTAVALEVPEQVIQQMMDVAPSVRSYFEDM